MSTAVELERRGAVTEIVLNGPARRNALSPQTIESLRDAFSDPDVRGADAVLLRGAGDFFCAGLDLTRIDPGDPPLQRWIAVHQALADLDVPVIAAVAGGAINAGAALALGCDLIVIEADAYLQIKEAAMGLAPPVNAAWLALRCPASVANQIALSCRRFSAAELLRLGLVWEVTNGATLVERGRQLAVELSQYPDRAAVRTKRMLQAARFEQERFRSAVEAAVAAAHGG